MIRGWIILLHKSEQFIEVFLTTSAKLRGHIKRKHSTPPFVILLNDG